MPKKSSLLSSSTLKRKPSPARVVDAFDPGTRKWFKLRIGGDPADTPKGQLHVLEQMRRAEEAGFSMLYLMDD